MREETESGELANQDLKELWKRRPNRDYLSSQERVWITVSGEEKMETNQEETAENDKMTFKNLTPHKAFVIIKKLVNPIYNTCRRNRNGSYTAQIPRDELDLALRELEIDGVKVIIKKDEFRNTVRGTVFSFDTKSMPEAEILERI